MDRPDSTEVAAEPVFEQIETVSLTERVISALKDAFFSGKLKPGDPIIERQLAREMNVGTPVVREALLEHAGAPIVTSLLHRYEVEVAELLTSLFPGAERVVFGKNGSDACTAAARVARAATGRNFMLCHGYHLR